MDGSQLGGIERLTKEKNIREIYLFGSVARAEQDEYSDIDILIVIDECSEEEYFKLKDKYACFLNLPVSWLSVYRINKIRAMHKNGSYFLWHIKKEGKVLYSRDGELAKLLLTLPWYTNVESDLREYDEILTDIKCELDNEYISVNYELAVLASLVRNTCIAISYMNGRLDFGRNSVVLYCFSEYNFNISLEEYKELYRYRLYHTEKVDNVPDGEIGCLKKWIKIESDLLEIAKRGAKDYEKKLYQEWNNILLLEKVSPYVFRTKLERVLDHTVKYADYENDNHLSTACKLIIHKLKYISDQSNQTSDGCLNSFTVLKQDMLAVKAGLEGQAAFYE